MLKGTFDENIEAFNIVFSLISAIFFLGGEEAVSFERSKTGSSAEVAGNTCLVGLIATFIENRHLSYHEMVYNIPCRNLIIMQKDKLHVVYGDVLEEVSEEEYFKGKSRREYSREIKLKPEFTNQNNRIVQ